MEIIDFKGIKIDNVTLAEAVAKAEQLVGSGPHLIVTPNPEMIVACQDDAELRTIINNASLRVPDGISMVVVSRILGRPLKERVTGIDLMLKIVAMSARQGLKLFLLGGKPGVAKEAAANLIKNYPGVNIVGTHDGYFANKDSEVIKFINDTGPDILFAGLGAGKQERWLSVNLPSLGVKLGMGVGGSFDVIAGVKKRAPKWAQDLYVEWLYRLITEPERWKRQLALPKFLWLMFVTAR